MSESQDTDDASNGLTEVTATVRSSDVVVRKVASLHRQSAVAVYLTIRSSRDERCTVRVSDVLPEPLQEQDVEFHPNYDPVNWTHADGALVYAATIQPGENRTTVYGVTIDDPSQVELLETEPAIDVIANQRPAELDEPDEPAELADASSFAFGLTDPSVGASRQEASDGPSSGPVRAESADWPDLPGDLDPVQVLVDELESRELTDEERSVLLEALDLGGPEVGDGRLDSLREDVEALEKRLDREVRWRSRLRRHLRLDPADADSDDR